MRRPHWLPLDRIQIIRSRSNTGLGSLMAGETRGAIYWLGYKAPIAFVLGSGCRRWQLKFLKFCCALESILSVRAPLACFHDCHSILSIRICFTQSIFLYLLCQDVSSLDTRGLAVFRIFVGMAQIYNIIQVDPFAHLLKLTLHILFDNNLPGRGWRVRSFSLAIRDGFLVRKL